MAQDVHGEMLWQQRYYWGRRRWTRWMSVEKQSKLSTASCFRVGCSVSAALLAEWGCTAKRLNFCPREPSVPSQKNGQKARRWRLDFSKARDYHARNPEPPSQARVSAEARGCCCYFFLAKVTSGKWCCAFVRCWLPAAVSPTRICTAGLIGLANHHKRNEDRAA